ncbi:hypothetical protein CTAYLR_006009 [Chrysophaeum taylorii]|uniref:AB hydrolase-1 domain-containing protein n=1 Tax=Chrysophaeum taylorii TaxID=2483200 RepID=A0AAD7U5U0_9STRA|nr:hypothetical protein CTAYLR_006009 [Chrysophaeum taylorii]
MWTKLSSTSFVVLIIGACARSSSMADLELEIKNAYVDRNLVTRREVVVAGERVEYLEAGEGRPVVFCHGAAFSMRTWQYVGVLDALASRGFRAIAINLPGYGASSRTIGDKRGREGFLASFTASISLPSPFVVVAASMGGSYGLPFVMRTSVAGYVTVAGMLGALGSQRLDDVPVLAIYGSEDARLSSDERLIKSSFGTSELVVMENAPHPCYLRDAVAAEQFTRLILDFVGATHTEGTKVRAKWS